MSTDNPQARLEALGGLAASVDAENPSHEQAQAQEKEAAAIDAKEAAAREWGFIPYTVGGLVCMLAPELKEVYTEERCLEWGRQASAVAEKYGWNSPANMPEIGLLACSLTFVLPTALTLRAKAQEVREGKASGMLAKLGIWWRARQAKRAAAGGKGGPDVVDAEAKG